MPVKLREVKRCVAQEVNRIDEGEGNEEEEEKEEEKEEVEVEEMEEGYVQGGYKGCQRYSAHDTLCLEIRPDDETRGNEMT
jgi:hypothetical protein